MRFNMMTTLLRIASCSCLAALSQPSASQAELRDLPLGNGYSFAPYGQLNFALQSFEDGQLRTTNPVDISNANSRFGFFIQRDGDAAGLSFQFESGLGFRPSSATSQTNTPRALDWSRGDLRQVQLIYRGRFGLLRFGQGSMPLDGAAESDLGGTVVVAKSTIPEANGAYIFRTAAGALSDVTIGDTFNNFDGARRMRLRFDTTAVSGFTLAVAYGKEALKSGDNKDYYDLAIRFSETYGPIEIVGAVGVAYARGAAETTRTTVGSLSVLGTRTGLNLSLAAGRNARSGADYIYLKGGWNASLLGMGDTKLIVEGFQGDDYLAAGARSEMWGLAMIQDIDAANVEAYIGYRAFSYADGSVNDYQDANAIQFGARWRF